MWWKDASGDYVNAGHVTALTTVTAGSNWVVNATVGAGQIRLSGTYASQADAQDAARKLVHGFDPASL